MEHTLFLGLNIYAWITIFLLVFKIVMLITGKLSSDIVGFIIVAVLLLTGTLSEQEGLAGFSTTSVITLGVLFIVITGLVHSGVTHIVERRILGKPKTAFSALAHLMFPVASLSAIFNNAAVVALFINIVKLWAKRIKISPSKLLLPMSYAATLGGACTLVGSTSNLIIAGLYEDQMGEPLHFFAPFFPAFCCLMVCTTIVILYRKHLPDRKAPEEAFESRAEYTVELMVPTENELVGNTIEQTGLANVNGGHLIEIVRFDREIISPVPADEFILGGDHLVYSGKINSILELRETYGLVNATHHVYNVNEISKNRRLQTGTVAPNSPFVGHRMVDLNFEDENDVVLVAVAREGERIQGIPREIVLRAGDTLLLEGEKLKPEHFMDTLLFFDSIALPQEGNRTIIASLIVGCMVLLTAFNVMSLLKACLLAALAMMATGCCSAQQVRQGLNWKLLMVFVGSYCMGLAISVTGIADLLASGVAQLCGSNAFIALVLICTFGCFVTEFLSNASAGALLAPVALKTAISLGCNPIAFCVGLMLSVTCGLASPVGSETNLLIYGPGGFKFMDFIKFGFPMNLIMLITNITVISIFYL
jgi:di/tricarboxylate transporter